jgi:creatinine amidohydrolase
MAVRMWQHLSTTDFQNLDRARTLVLMPLGATEQHGPHLPVGTDHLLVEEVLRRVRPQVDKLEILLLPVLWCTKSNEHVAFAGSLYLQAETLMAVVHDICAAISRSGFNKLVIMNWHGGNTDLLGALARDIRQRHRLQVFIIDIVRIFMGPGYDSQGLVEHFDIHAGRYETGMMLAAYPDLVKPGSYRELGSDMKRGRTADSFAGYRFLVPEGGPVYVGWETTDLTPDGVIGNPAGANAEEGGRDLAELVDRVAGMLAEIADFEFKS